MKGRATDFNSQFLSELFPEVVKFIAKRNQSRLKKAVIVPSISPTSLMKYCTARAAKNLCEPLKQKTFRSPIMLLVLPLLLIPSCQSYSPDPLDLSSHQKNWQKRSAAGKEVQAFADQLSKTSKKPNTFNPSDGISLEEAQIIALIYNPELRVSRLKVGVSMAEEEHTGLWKDPEFGLDFRKITESISKPWILSSSLNFTIPITGRLKSEKKAAELKTQINLLRLREMEAKIAHQLSKTWVKWSSLEMKMKETQRINKLISELIKTTDKMIHLGELAKNEASLLRIILVEHQVELTGFKGEIKAIQQKIRSLMGLTPNSPIQFTPSIFHQYKPFSEKPSKKQRLPLQRLELEYNLAEVELKKEIQKQFPDIKLGPNFESDQGQSSIGLISGIPLPILNSNKGGIASAKAKRTLARSELEQEYERGAGAISLLKLKLESLSQIKAHTKRDLIPLLDRQLNETKELTELGEANLLLLLESLTHSHDTKIRLIEISEKQSLTNLELFYLKGPQP